MHNLHNLSRDELLVLLQDMAQGNPDPVFVKNSQGRYLMANKATASALGCTVEELIGQTDQELMSKEVATALTDSDRRVISTGRALHIDEVTEADGSRSYWHSTKVPYRDLRGEVVGVIGIARNISEQRLLERRLRESEAFYRSIFELEGIGCGVLDASGLLTKVNPVFERMFGYSAEELRGFTNADLTYAEDQVLTTEYMRALTAGEIDSFRVDKRYVRKDGTVFWGELVTSAVRDEQGRLNGFIGIILDISEKQTAAKRLADSELRLQEAQQLAHVGSWEWSIADGGEVWSDEQFRIFGYEPGEIEPNYDTFKNALHPDDRDRVLLAVERALQGEPYNLRFRIVRRDETTVDIEARGKVEFDTDKRPLRMLGTVQDITRQCAYEKEIKRAKAQLVQADKMSALGQLAAGVAHEINNPVGYVSANLNTLQSYFDDLLAICDAVKAFVAEPSAKESSALKSLEQVIRQVDMDYLRSDLPELFEETSSGLARIKTIAENLKGFSRVNSEQWQEANINDEIDAALTIVWNELKYKCIVEKEYGELPNILCMPGELNQVFVNLLVNASHAIEERGTIRIRTLVHDDRVCLEFHDTGMGISKESIKQIFEPFYTTKPVGKGTGLGLSVSHGIIKKHHGKIEVESALGAGTTFRIWLPLDQSTDQTRQDAT